MTDPDIRLCASSDDYDLAIKVTKSYVDWIGIDLSFQDIDREMTGFADMYGPPGGFYLLGFVGKQLAGGVGLRALETSDDINTCEMKRLYVYDHSKGHGIGRILCESLLCKAGEMGYRRIRLDTLADMRTARALYQDIGFYEIDPYRFNPKPGTTYLERMLPYKD